MFFLVSYKYKKPYRITGNKEGNKCDLYIFSLTTLQTNVEYVYFQIEH